VRLLVVGGLGALAGYLFARYRCRSVGLLERAADRVLAVAGEMGGDAPAVLSATGDPYNRDGGAVCCSG
jgi:hypothetical protein